MAMKAKSLFLLFFLSVLNFQCTTDTDDPNEILKQSESTEDVEDFPDESTNTPNESRPQYFINGFSNISNARLVVNGISSFEVTEGYEYLRAELMGGAGPGPAERSNSTGVFLDSAQSTVYIYDYGYQLISPLFVTDAWGFKALANWDLKVSVVEEAGLEQEITISGSGKGSHIFYDCWGIVDEMETYDAFLERNDISFEFRGIRMEGTEDYFQGPFSLTENSTDQTCMLNCSGIMTLIRQ